MIKLLHSADWHLDSPFTGRQDALQLREQLLTVPERIAALGRKEHCQLLLLSGDIFDGQPTSRTLSLVKEILGDLPVPVFISPGNHDYASPDSPWLSGLWPGNVHIFTKPAVTSIPLPELDCRVYGGAFLSMDCPGLLEGFHAKQKETYALGIFHGDPTNLRSPYCPVTRAQILNSGLNYLALGHIHKGGQLKAGKTLCAWPGCPMGRGYDEPDDKGVLLVSLDQETSAEFISLGLPRFFDLFLDVDCDAGAALSKALPPVGSNDHYRITLTGTSEAIRLAQLQQKFSHFSSLELIDKTRLPLDLWRTAGEDNLEGMFFSLLRDSLDSQDSQDRRITLLAAEIARTILDDEEVHLP